MSTKTTLFSGGSEYGENGKHEIGIHIYKELHEPEESVIVEINCSTCYCNYKFLMTEHLGMQLANILKETSIVPKIRRNKNDEARRTKRRRTRKPQDNGKTQHN